ncbi:DinB family protein [Mucisphaera sp.]|uniref:DinB family protein n=1 Tax=Mucisphaera sp. TaxID=2913024 RepID=UPI003D12DE90
MKTQILGLYAHTLSEAKKLVADVPDERFAELPYLNAKHPAWVLAHLAVGSGMLAGCLLGDPKDFAGVPASWSELGQPGGPVSGDRSLFPSKADLLTTLEAVHGTLAGLVETMTEKELAAEFVVPEWRDFFPTNGVAIAYMLGHHEGYHLGQLTQWRMATGFGPPEGAF